MAFKKGEIYVCQESDCGCEITVTKSAAPDCSGNHAPTCCCGKTMNKKEKKMSNINYSNTITCPHCGSRSKEVMPENACEYFWQCPECDTILKPLPNDCCVYCSYGDIDCPPKQEDDNTSISIDCC